MIYGPERALARKSLEDAAKAYADADVADLKRNAEKYWEDWRIERQRAEMIRSIAGCPAAYVEALAKATAEILRQPPEKTSI